MHTTDPIEKRLMELEIKASFTEDLLDQLNQTIYRQQQDIERLAREVVRLRIHSQDSPPGEPRSVTDDLPPHY
jgi:SlyX protein